MGAVVTRRRHLLAAVALVAGACGNGSNDGTTRTTLDSPGAPSTNVTTDTTVSRAPGSATTRQSGRGGNPTATTRGEARAGNDDAIRAASRNSAGAFAGILLAPGPATNIVVELLVQPGVAPDGEVINTLRTILGASSGKPVAVSGPKALNSTQATYDSEDIRRLADAQGRAQGDGAAVLHLLYLKGAFSDDSVLGVTVRADTMAVFPEQITRATSPLVSRRRLEQAVATHELGHILGLVDLYLDDNRDDPEHPGHSTNPRSVMYWAVESDLVSQALDGPPPVDFDGADQNDLRRIHGGAASAAR